MSPDHLVSDADLAQGVLRMALEELQREAAVSGREALFLALLPLLGEPEGSTLPNIDGLSPAEVGHALRRLRQRFRERVNARLRAIESSAPRRRQLRQRLRAALTGKQP